jgi:hypothetical protein
VPDICAWADCNANGILDECDVAARASNDGLEEGISDECQIAAGAAEIQVMTGNFHPYLEQLFRSSPVQAVVQGFSAQALKNLQFPARAYNVDRGTT